MAFFRPNTRFWSSLQIKREREKDDTLADVTREVAEVRSHGQSVSNDRCKYYYLSVNTAIAGLHYFVDMVQRRASCYIRCPPMDIQTMNEWTRPLTVVNR